MLRSSFSNEQNQIVSYGAATKLARSLILSCLDNANSLLFGFPDTLLDKLQMVHNSAARLILRMRKRDHVTILFKTSILATC